MSRFRAKILPLGHIERLCKLRRNSVGSKQFRGFLRCLYDVLRIISRSPGSESSVPDGLLLVACPLQLAACRLQLAASRFPLPACRLPPASRRLNLPRAVCSLLRAACRLPRKFHLMRVRRLSGSNGLQIRRAGLRTRQNGGSHRDLSG